MKKIEFLSEFQVAAEQLIESYGVLVIITLFLRWVASLAAVLLMILDTTKWKCSNNMLTSLLAPYLFASLPLVIFNFLRIGFGEWIALLIVVIRLFLPNSFHESLEIPGATILLIVVTPSYLVNAFRDDQPYTNSSMFLLTSFFLIDKHTKACGGFKNSFTQKDKITYTISLHLLFFYFIWSSLLTCLPLQLRTQTSY